MSIRRTSRGLLAALLLMSLVTFGSALESARLRQLQVQAWQERMELQQMADLLAAGSDRLTAAVRGYAATGERHYLEAFQAELREAKSRDFAMERLRQLGAAPTEMTLFEEAKANSDALVGLEARAIEAVARNDLRQAVSLVYGSEYKDAKRSIMEPLQQGRAALAARLSHRADQLGQRAVRATALSLAALALDLVSVLAVLALFYGRRVVRPLVALSRSLRELAEGRTGVLLGSTRDSSELGDLARALESYQQRVEQAESERWVKTRVVDVAKRVDGAGNPRDFGQHLLSGLMPLVGGVCAAFFVGDEASGSFQFAAGYACLDAPAFSEGRGLGGQAAAEKRLIVVSSLPEGYLKVRSGAGEIAPQLVAAVPLRLGERVLAVLEVACSAGLTPQHRELLEEVGLMASLKLDVLLRNQRTRELLERVRASEEQSRRANFLSDIALELTGCGYWHVDYSDPEFYWQSERAVRILGEEPREDGRYHLQDEWFARLVAADPEMAARTAQLYEDAVAGRIDGYDATYPYRRPCDGEVIWLHAAGKLERGPDGKVAHMYGVYQDITEFKRLEARLAGTTTESCRS